jgi:hypothetical protein
VDDTKEWLKCVKSYIEEYLDAQSHGGGSLLGGRQPWARFKEEKSFVFCCDVKYYYKRFILLLLILPHVFLLNLARNALDVYDNSIASSCPNMSILAII